MKTEHLQWLRAQRPKYFAKLRLGRGELFHEQIHYFNEDMQEIAILHYEGSEHESLHDFNPPREWHTKILKDYHVEKIPRFFNEGDAEADLYNFEVKLIKEKFISVTAQGTNQDEARSNAVREAERKYPDYDYHVLTERINNNAQQRHR